MKEKSYAIGPWLPLSLCVGHSGPAVEGLQASIASVEHTPVSARGPVIWKRLPLLTLELKPLLLRPKHPLFQRPPASSVWEFKGVKCPSGAGLSRNSATGSGVISALAQLWSSPGRAGLTLLLPSQWNNPVPPPDPQRQAPQVTGWHWPFFEFSLCPFKSLQSCTLSAFLQKVNTLISGYSRGSLASHDPCLPQIRFAMIFTWRLRNSSW